MNHPPSAQTITRFLLCCVSAVVVYGCESKEDRCTRIGARWERVEKTPGVCQSNADCSQYPRVDPGGMMGQPKYAGFSDHEHAEVLKRLAEEWRTQQCGPVIINIDTPMGRLSPCCHESRCTGCSPPSGRGY